MYSVKRNIQKETLKTTIRLIIKKEKYPTVLDIYIKINVIIYLKWVYQNNFILRFKYNENWLFSYYQSFDCNVIQNILGKIFDIPRFGCPEEIT